MAEAAGVINNKGLGEDTIFAQVIADASEQVQALARAVRGLVYEVLPETVEVVWPHQGTTGWGTGPKKMSEQFAYMMARKNHVTFGFYYGGELPDPSGLLGKDSKNKGAMRSLKITTLEEVRRPELRALVEAATRHRVPPPSRSG